MGDHDLQRVGYEDLLRPLKDVLLKNWRMSLAHVLDEFISHLQNDGFAMNFSQAAILLQNSTTFYCKRVDVVFRIMEELTDGISQLYMAVYCHIVQRMAFAKHEAEASSSTPVKKRRIARTLENDDLELLDFVYTDHNIDLNWRKFLKAPPPKQIVLNKDVKAVKKSNTAIPLLGSNGVFMGYKDDYRLHGKTWCDGTLNVDFNSNQEVAFWRDPDFEVNGVCNDDAHSDDRMDCSEPHEGLTNGLSEALVVEEPPIVPDQHTTINIKNLPPLKELKVKLCKVVDWDPVTFKFKFPLKVLKRRRVFALPKQLIEEAEEEMERQKKRKLRQDKKAAKLSNGISTEITNDNTIDEGIEFCGAQPSPENVMELTNGDSEIFKFKQQRHESGLLATEVAKRVAEWHESVLPKIQEEEKRRKFNVHEYGSKILDKFPDNYHTFRPFSEVVEGQPKHEICRHFLSCLMLANTYNVELRKCDNAPLATDCLELKLLTKVRHHDEMDEQLENLS